MVSKRFDRDLYNLTDSLAKNKCVDLLVNLGYDVRENPLKTKVDLLVYKDDKHIFNVETEIKLVWRGKFQYDSVQFPERKSKFASLEKPTYFIMWNADQSEYLVVKDKDLLSSPVQIVRNKYVKYGEYFFQVPLNKVTFNKFQE